MQNFKTIFFRILFLVALILIIVRCSLNSNANKAKTEAVGYSIVNQTDLFV